MIAGDRPVRAGPCGSCYWALHPSPSQRWLRRSPETHAARHDRDRLDLADGLGAKTGADLQTERTNFARFDDGAALVTLRLVAAKPYESSINRCRTVSTASR